MKKLVFLFLIVHCTFYIVNAQPCQQPLIYVHPYGGTFCPGSVYAMSVIVGSGTPPFNYIWYKDGQPIPYAYQPALVLNPVEAGSYYCFVYNACGSMFSNSALVKVIEPPVITYHPSDVTSFTSAPVLFHIEATGSNLAYQWQEDGINLYNSEVYSNVYSPYLGISDISGLNGKTYRCVVTDSCGQSAISNSALLTACKYPIINQSQGGKVCYGKSHTLYVETDPAEGPYSYQWWKIKNHIYEKITDATNSSYTINSVTDYYVDYYCDVTNYCGTIYSKKIRITVNYGFSIIKNPTGGEICSGNFFNFIVEADNAGGPYSYQWYKDSQLIEGGTDSNLNINNVSKNDEGEYACLVSNFCGELTSNNAQLKVINPSHITSQPTGGDYCSGEKVTLSIEATGDLPLTYTWYKNGSLFATTYLNSLLITMSNDNAGQYRCRVENSCGYDMSQEVTLGNKTCMYKYLGQILYKNLKRGPLKNAAVNLRSKDGSVYRRAEADNYGRYEMTDVSDTTFTVEADISEPWGGADPLDALLINRKFIHIYDITDNLKLSAADINKDGAITPTDALLANRRFIGLIDSFKQDWLWETERIQQISRKEFYYEIRAICTGDVNASFNPSGKKK